MNLKSQETRLTQAHRSLVQELEEERQQLREEFEGERARLIAEANELRDQLQELETNYQSQTRDFLNQIESSKENPLDSQQFRELLDQKSDLEARLQDYDQTFEDMEK